MPDPTGARIAVPADLAESGPTITGIANNIGDELSQLASLLAPLQDYWSGQANISWQSLQNIWNTAANNLMSTTGTLGSIGTTAGVNWMNYSDAEAANIATWAH